MKLVTVLFAFVLSLPAWAQTLQLGEFDQAKLGEFLDALPRDLTLRNVQSDASREGVRMVTLEFPKNPGPFRMQCSRYFFHEAPYPSETICLVTVDKAHPESELKHDVVRVTITEQRTVRAIHATIPYGRPQKKMYSYQRDPGTTFDGSKGTIFHYQVICSETKCWFKFSNLLLLKGP